MRSATPGPSRSERASRCRWNSQPSARRITTIALQRQPAPQHPRLRVLGQQPCRCEDHSFATYPDSANLSWTSYLRSPAWIHACHRPGDALDRVSERTNHLKAWRQGQHPLQTQTTLRGLETHHPTVCRRDPNRAASVRPDSEIRRPYCPHTTADWMTRPEPDADS